MTSYATAAPVYADADPQADIIGTRVEAGKGEDHDTGRIVAIDGDMAIVAWDSGVRTPCPLADLSAL